MPVAEARSGRQTNAGAWKKRGGMGHSPFLFHFSVCFLNEGKCVCNYRRLHYVPCMSLSKMCKPPAPHTHAHRMPTYPTQPNQTPLSNSTKPKARPAGVEITDKSVPYKTPLDAPRRWRFVSSPERAPALFPASVACWCWWRVADLACWTGAFVLRCGLGLWLRLGLRLGVQVVVL